MNKLQRLYCREIIKLFVLLSLLFSFILALIGLFDRYDYYVSEGLNGFKILEVSILRVPEFLGYLIPLTLMLSIVLVFSFASKNREILIIKVSGANLKSFLIPIIGLTVLVLLLQVAVQELLYPISKSKAQKIIEHDSKGFLYKNGILWLRSDDKILRAEGFDPYNAKLSNVYIFSLEKNKIVKVVTAQRAVKKNRTLLLSNAVEYDIINRNVKKQDHILVDFSITRDVLIAGQKRIEEMSGFELMKIYTSLKNSGIENIKLSVDLQRRLAYPLFTIIFALLGLYLSIRFVSPWIAIGMATALVVLLWGLLTLFTALGYAGVIPPILAGWLLPAVGLVISVTFFIQMQI